MIKEWEVIINYLYGCEFIRIKVKANTERKAKMIALNKVKRERGDTAMFVCGCKLV